MSPVNKSTHNLIAIAITAVIVFSALPAAAQTSTKQKTPLTTKPTTDVKKLTPNPTEQPSQTPCPEIKVSCPGSIDPGAPLTCSANLSFRAASTVPKYFWSVSSGRITQGQGTSLITVNTANVSAKQLTVTLSLPQFGKGCAGSSVVTLKRPGEVVVVTPAGEETKPVCPQIAMACPTSVVAGKEISCSVNLSGGRKGAVPRYSWSVTSGRITQGQGTSAITVSTADVKEKTSIIRLDLGGFGTKCVDRKVVQLDDSAPPPSPTTPTPSTPSPTAAPTSPLGGIVTPSSPSPVASVESSPGSTISPTAIDSALPALLAPIGAVAAIIAALAALYWFRVRQPRRGEALLPDGPAPPTDVDESRQRLDALILGAKRQQDEEVTCTVFAPYEAGRGDGFLVQAFAHLPAQASLLQDIATQADQAAAERRSKKLGPIERGEELGFYLQMPGLEIDEPQQSVIWMGEITSAEFGVTVPENFKPRSVNCKLSVSRQNVPIGHVRFNFKISDAPQPAEKVQPEGHPDFVRYKLAFISYASADRSEVMKRVQMLDLAKIKYFQDLLSLEAGKQWEPLIYRYIDECDVFYLFWSSAAKKSDWVEKEVQRALQRKGDNPEAPPEILPIPIEGPPPVEPPPYLGSIHFDSKFLYFINPRS